MDFIYGMSLVLSLLAKIKCTYGVSMLYPLVLEKMQKLQRNLLSEAGKVCDRILVERVQATEWTKFGKVGAVLCWAEDVRLGFCSSTGYWNCMNSRMKVYFTIVDSKKDIINLSWIELNNGMPWLIWSWRLVDKNNKESKCWKYMIQIKWNMLFQHSDIYIIYLGS